MHKGLFNSHQDEPPNHAKTIYYGQSTSETDKDLRLMGRFLYAIQYPRKEIPIKWTPALWRSSRKAYTPPDLGLNVMNVMGKSSCKPYVHRQHKTLPLTHLRMDSKKKDITFRSVFSKAEDFCGKSVKNLDASCRFFSYLASENGSVKTIITSYFPHRQDPSFETPHDYIRRTHILHPFSMYGNSL